MDESTVRRVLVMDKVTRATMDIRELDEDWRLIVVSAEDRRDQLNARVEIRAQCEAILAQVGFDVDGATGQTLKSVLEYFEGEEWAGL